MNYEAEDGNIVGLAAPYASEADHLLDDYQKFEQLEEDDVAGRELMALRCQVAIAHALTSIALSLRAIAQRQADPDWRDNG